MLFIDDEQVTARELARKFGLDFEAITKAPKFENKQVSIDPVTKARRFNQGVSMRSRFYARDPETAKEVRIQYAKSAGNKQVGDKLQKLYEPIYVQYNGEIFSHYDDHDLAIFFALHPLCVASPIKTQKKTKKRFEFIDRKARAVSEIEAMDNLDKANYHAKTASYDQLVMISKGLLFKGVDEMDEDELRVAVRKYAIQNTQKYIDAIDSKVVKVEGRVRDLVDKKVFVLDAKGAVRQWKWDKGPHEGQPIGDQITNRTQDAVDYLVKYVLDNPEENVERLFTVHQNMATRERAASVLDTIEIPDLEPAKSDSYTELPLTDVESVKAFMAEHGYKKIPADVKMLREAIDAGQVDSHDILVYMDKNFSKANPV